VASDQAFGIQGMANTILKLRAALDAAEARARTAEEELLSIRAHGFPDGAVGRIAELEARAAASERECAELRETARLIRLVLDDTPAGMTSAPSMGREFYGVRALAQMHKAAVAEWNAALARVESARREAIEECIAAIPKPYKGAGPYGQAKNDAWRTATKALRALLAVGAAEKEP